MAIALFEIAVEPLFSRIKWLRVVACAVVIFGAFEFSKQVVLYQDPLSIQWGVGTAPYATGTRFAGIEWNSSLRDVRISILNDTDTSYENLDLNLSIDANVIEHGHDDSISGVTFDENEVVVGRTLPDGTFQRLPFMQNHYRVKIPRLDPNQPVVVVFAVNVAEVS